MQHVGSQFPDQELNLLPLHWKHRVFTAGSPGKSWLLWLYNKCLSQVASVFQHCSSPSVLCWLFYGLDILDTQFIVAPIHRMIFSSSHVQLFSGLSQGLDLHMGVM